MSIEFSGVVVRKIESWTEFKTYFLGPKKYLNLQCESDNDRYFLFVLDGHLACCFTIWKSAEHPLNENPTENAEIKTEFENYYLENCNLEYYGLCVGGRSTRLDGSTISLSESQFGVIDYSMPVDGYIQSVCIDWENAKLGDYGWLAIINPLSITNLVEIAYEGATKAKIGSSFEDKYLLTAATCIEFWNSEEDSILEVHKITSVDTETHEVNFSGGLVADRNTSVKVKARIGGFCPIRGSAGLDGGFRLLGTGHCGFCNEHELSALLQLGTIISSRFITCDISGTRNFVVNYKLRRK